MGLEAVGGDDGGGLGQSVALEHGDAEGVEEALELDVEQGPAADEELEAAAEVLPDLGEQELVVKGQERFLQLFQAEAAVPALGVVVVGQGQGPLEEGLDLGAFLADAFLDVLAEVLGQGGNAEEEVGPDLADVAGQVPDRLHRRPPELDRGHGRAALHHRIDAAGVAEAVVPGQDEERDVMLRAVDEAAGLVDVGGVVPVGEHDALGIGRRPRGIADIGEVALPDGRQGRLEVRRPGLEERVAAAEDFGGRELVGGQVLDVVQDDRRGQVRQVVPDLADLGELRLRNDRDAAAGVGQTELQVAELVHLDRDGDVDGPERQDGQLAHDPVPAPLGDEGGPVAPAEPEGHEAGGEAADELAHLGEGRGLVAGAPLLPNEDVRGSGRDAFFE